jgi:hypothetical protein
MNKDIKQNSYFANSAAEQSPRHKCLEVGNFLRTLGHTEECVFITQTDVVGLSCVNDANQKIGVDADKLTGV